MMRRLLSTGLQPRAGGLQQQQQQSHQTKTDPKQQTSTILFTTPYSELSIKERVQKKLQKFDLWKRKKNLGGWGSSTPMITAFKTNPLRTRLSQHQQGRYQRYKRIYKLKNIVQIKWADWTCRSDSKISLGGTGGAAKMGGKELQTKTLQVHGKNIKFWIELKRI